MAKTSMMGGKGADARKAMAPKPKKSSLKISAKRPMDAMSAGPMMPGMKKGGSCGTTRFPTKFIFFREMEKVPRF